MRTQVTEVDEDMFQIITLHDNGDVTVESFMNYNAYMQHGNFNGHDRGPLSDTRYPSRLWH